MTARLELLLAALLAGAACETTIVGPKPGLATSARPAGGGAPSRGGVPPDAGAAGAALASGGTTSGTSARAGEGGEGEARGGRGTRRDDGGSSVHAGSEGGADAQAGAPGASGEGGSVAGAPPRGDGGESGADVFGAPARCTSGAYRDPNESEGPEMMPGVACNACHAQANAESGEGDAPIFAFAGTVFPSAHEPDSCVASESAGALVVVRDAQGAEFTAAVNAVGNFALESGELVFPITARVIAGGRERAMVRPAAHGDCNLCHSLGGSFAAPGRVVLP